MKSWKSSENQYSKKYHFQLVVILMILLFSATWIINGSPVLARTQGIAVLIWNDEIRAGFEARWFIETAPSLSSWNELLLPIGPLFPLLDSVPSADSTLSVKIIDDPPTSSSDNFSWSVLAPYDGWIEIRLDDQALAVGQGLILLMTPQRVKFNQTENNITIPVNAFGATIAFDLIKSELEGMVNNLKQEGVNPTLTNTSAFEEPLLSFSWILASDVGTLNATITFDASRGLLEEYHVTLLDASLNVVDELLIVRDTSSGGFVPGFDVQAALLGMMLVTILIIVKKRKF